VRRGRDVEIRLPRRLTPAQVADVRHLVWLQRRAWARELGLDPATADLLALPPVPPREVLPDASDVIARMSA